MPKVKNEQVLFKAQYTCDQVEKLSIDTALQKNRIIPHRKIQVTVLANHVILSGNMYTRHARKEAGRIAMQTAGVFSISNNILVTGLQDA